VFGVVLCGLKGILVMAIGPCGWTFAIFPRKKTLQQYALSPELNGVKIRRIWDVFALKASAARTVAMHLSQRLLTWIPSCMNLVPFIRPEVAKKA
jgi:hypothetical protein